MERLRYSITLEDLVASSRFHASHSPTFRRSWRFQTWVYPPLLAGFALVSIALSGRLSAYSSALLLLAVVWPFAYPRYLRWHFTRQVRRLYSEGSNAAILGTHEAIATDEGLTVVTPGDESRIRWHAIERLSATQDYAFLYIAANQAVVVPRQAIVEGSFEAFLAYVRQRKSQVIA